MIFTCLTHEHHVTSHCFQSDALLKSGNSQVTLTGGAWSPTRPGNYDKYLKLYLLIIYIYIGVFFIAKHNGNIDVWDLMDRLVF